MRHIVKQFVFQSTLLGLIVAGYAYEIDGARNLVAFFIWGFLLPGSVLVNADSVVKATAKEPKKPALWRWISWPIRMASLGILIWFGAPFTATAFAVSTLLMLAAQASIEKARAAA